jgi:hypothetical protein
MTIILWRDFKRDLFNVKKPGSFALPGFFVRTAISEPGYCFGSDLVGSRTNVWLTVFASQHRIGRIVIREDFSPDQT